MRAMGPPLQDRTHPTCRGASEILHDFCVRRLSLDARGVGNAIALAASFAGSLIEGQRTGARDADFAEAQAARSGMWAASLAAQGFAGAPTALEGEGGFYYAFTGSHTGELTYAFTGPLKADLDDVVA